MQTPASAAGRLQPAASPAQGLDAANNLGSATADEIGTALAQFSDQPQAIIHAWTSSNADGLAVIASTPSKMRAQINRLFPSQPHATQVAMFRFIRDSLIQTHARSAELFDPDTFSLWQNASFSVVPPMSHGGGGAITHVPHQPLVNPSAWSTPYSAKDVKERPMKFAFGRAASPISAFGLGPAPTPSFGQGPFSFLPNAGASTNRPLDGATSFRPPDGVPASRPTDGMPASYPNDGVSANRSPEGVPASRPNEGVSSHRPNDGASANHSHYPSLQQTLHQQNLQLMSDHQLFNPSAMLPDARQALMFSPPAAVHEQPRQAPLFSRSGQPLKPWEVEASMRAPRHQDASMMPGFERRSIAKIIADARAKRMRLGTTVGVPQVYKEVKYPTMTQFRAEEFTSTRKEFYAATRASVNSCLFKDFKDCLTDTTRTTAARRFKMSDDDFTALDDSKFQLWMNVMFGPKSKKDAMDRLEGLQFPEHEDKYDSQADFMNKLDSFAFDFEMIINDIADTHETWAIEDKGLDSGELTCKEVMKVFREKFPKTAYKSSQMKECRKFMDRNQDLLFNDIVLRLSEYFTDIDVNVAGGKTSYTTTPTMKRHQPAKASEGSIPAKRASPVHHNERHHTGQSARGGAGQTVRGGAGPTGRQHMTPIPGSRNSTRNVSGRKVVRGADRGIACGHLTNHFGGGCKPEYCVFVGTKHDKNKNGHVWQDSDKEESVFASEEEYKNLCKARPDALKNQGALKDQYNRTRHNLRVSAIQAGEDVSSSDSDDPDADALRDEFNDQVGSESDSNDQVNAQHYFVSALSASAARTNAVDNDNEITLGKQIFRAERMMQFFGKSRIVNDDGKNSFVKTLMDPGAEFNIISPQVRDVCELRSLPLQVSLFQGKRRQCSVQLMSYCRFELQNKDGSFIKHGEWFTVADIGYDMLLGRKFCKDNGFTKFDELLEEWSADADESNVAVSALSSTVSSAPSDNPITSVTMSGKHQSGLIGNAERPTESSFSVCRFQRVEPEPGDARYKRQPKALRFLKSTCDQKVNRISQNELNATNPLSALNVLDVRTSLNKTEIKLEFFIECNSDHPGNKFVEWFVVDNAVDKGFVVLASASKPAMFAASHGIWKQQGISQPCQRQSDVIAESKPASSVRDPAFHDAEHNSNAVLRKRSAASEISNQPTKKLPAVFVPRLSDQQVGILRLTNNDARSRSALTMKIDSSAAHNAIDSSWVSESESTANIAVFDRKVVAGVTMAMLEFSLDCEDQSGSRVKFREWFRLIDQLGRQNTILRGIFDNQRFQNDQSGNALSEFQQRRQQNDRLQRQREHAPSRALDTALSVAGLSEKALTIDERTQAIAAAKLFKDNGGSYSANRSQDKRFVSFHPVNHRAIIRDANRPANALPGDRKHASAKINQYDVRRRLMSAAVERANLQHEVSQTRSTLDKMISKLPAEMQQAERASVASIKRQPAAFVNFETELDSVSCCALQSDDGQGQAALANQWQSEFIVGSYVEICNAVNQTQLNGKRVRLYDKTASPQVWLIRVLGKNCGIMSCHEKYLKTLPIDVQASARPAGINAGFLDVGIDAAGQPTGEESHVVHRQFGAKYSEQLTAKIEELKGRYPTVFSKDVSEPCAFEKMSIKLIPNAILPSKSRFYRNTPKMKEEVRRQVQEQLDWGAIRRAETPHCSDVLLVKRPHMPGQFRFVINFQKLNEATVPEQLLMPDPASQHARLKGCKIFGALDMSSYFRQLELAEDSQYLTGFATDEGTFVHTRVPMGIRNAPSFAQRVLQEALAKDPRLGPLGIKNYFDDVPFGAKTEEEFLDIMEAMLEFCKKHRLKINPEKSIFGVTSITHVGFVISEEGISIDPERTRDIAELSAPKSIKKVQSVLGIFNYVRQFIPDFACKAKHLTDKLAAAPTGANKHSRNVQLKSPAPAFTWSEQDQIDFEELKRCVLSAPLLAQLDYSKQIFIRCDASRFGAGAVLFQYDENGRERVVCYASRKFIPAETRWSTFQQEASTVVWALERFLEFTQGYHVIVECDHRNISFVKRSSMPQLARWRMRLQDHDFSIHFLSGCLNQCADGLSRIHVDDVDVTLADAVPECSLLYAKPSAIDDYVAVSALEIAPYELRSRAVVDNAGSAQEAESDNDSDSSDDSDNSSDDGDQAAGPRFGPHGECLIDGEIVHVHEDQPGHIDAPMGSVTQEMAAVHNDLVGHHGVYVSLQRLLRNGRAWASRKQMLEDVDAFIRGCPTCQKMKKRRERCVVDRHTISGSPFAEISIDVLKLPRPDARGNKYVIVIVDSFSRWTSLTACVNKSAFDAARALVQFVGNFGTPLRLRSDGGGEFVNGVITGITRMMGVTPVVVQPFTPTANGIVERANRAILERVREMCFCERLIKHSHHQWGDLLPLVQRSINAAINMATGTSPSRILFGDSLDLDRAVLTRIPEGTSFDVESYCDVLAANQRIIIEEADRIQSAMCDKVIAKAAARQRSLPRRVLNVNDWVLVKPQPKYPLHKLAPRWLGPFRIAQISENSEKVVVEDTVARKLVKVLKRQLELFDASQVSNVTGLTKVAETDHFEFPVEAIMGHALISDQGVGVDAVQLGRDFVRGARRKDAFQFLIKWSGYEEPTWVAFKDAKRLVQFPGYVAVFPDLRML
jgi:hypothetical protein